MKLLLKEIIELRLCIEKIEGVLKLRILREEFPKEWQEIDRLQKIIQQQIKECDIPRVLIK